VEGGEVAAEAAVPASFVVGVECDDAAFDEGIGGDGESAVDVEGIYEATFEGLAGLHGVVARDFDLKDGAGGKNGLCGLGGFRLWLRCRDGIGGAVLQGLGWPGVGDEKSGSNEREWEIALEERHELRQNLSH
jgi:hypothetical protein